jgi:hypothetical protein
MTLTYDDLKTLAADLGCPVRELYALAAQNDPFFAGSPGRRQAAEWFADLWQKLAIRNGVHQRRIHYQLVSQRKPIRLWDGMPYHNTIECWTALGKASVAARYLDLVPVGAFVDRRNAEPTDHLAGYETAGFLGIWPDSPAVQWSLSPMPGLPQLTLLPPELAQRFHIEIWCEKTTVNDILRPLAERYRLCLVTGAGELSVTRCNELIARAAISQKPVRILYVSDFDPAGQSMPVAVARKIEFFNARDAGGALDIQLRPVVLTEDQCREYELPRTPIKESERRAARFEARFGTGATELDALEALHPGVLRRILRDEILRYYDPTLTARRDEAAGEVYAEIHQISADLRRDFADRIEPLEVEWQAIQEGMQDRVRDWHDRAAVVWTEMTAALEERAPDFDAIEWPEPADGDEDPDPLFDSTRTYVDQMKAYRGFQGRLADKRDPDEDADGGQS